MTINQQKQASSRAKPGTKKTGNYYRVVIRDKNQISSFRTQKVGDSGRPQRVAGHRKSGS